MRARYFEWSVVLIAIGLLAWALSGNQFELKDPLQEYDLTQEEYDVSTSALDFLWNSGYGQSGDFIALKLETAVPFPAKNIECPFYEPPPAIEPHQKRVESLERALEEERFLISSSPLRKRNQTRALWDLSKLKTKADLRDSDSLDKKSYSGEFYNQVETVLRKANGRFLISLSRPGIEDDKALLYAIDHGRWPSYVLLLSLERKEDGWSVTKFVDYSQSSYCSCGP